MRLINNGEFSANDNPSLDPSFCEFAGNEVLRFKFKYFLLVTKSAALYEIA